MPPSPPRVAATDVWPALQETIVEFRSLGSHVLRRQRLSVGQYLSLHRIQKSGGLRLSVLAEELGISRPATTALVESLEARGWVRRERSPSDRRGVVVRLTGRTLRMMAGLDQEIAAVVRRSMKGCPRDRRSGTVETLRELSEGMRTYRSTGSWVREERR
jgi:DNA-binding MarR family transcriptional regulator